LSISSAAFKVAAEVFMNSQKELIDQLKDSSSEEDRKKCIPLLQEYLKEHSQDAVAWYELACCFDFLGFEKEAEPCYGKTYELGWQQLPATEQAGFFVGFGSTLRNNLDFVRSEKILTDAIVHFPNYPALKVFLAFTLHSQGKFRKASEALFTSTVEMPEKAYDGYERAIKWYVENLSTHPIPAPTAIYDLDGIKIRAAKPADAAEIANVHLNSWREAYQGQLAPEFLDGMPFTFKSRKQNWEHFLAQHPNNLFVAEGERGIVGFMSLNTPGRDVEMKDHAEVGAIYLLARHKGKKVGLHLLKAGFKSLSERGFNKAYCWMLKGNPTAKFYESTGAKLNGKEKVVQIANKDEAEVMYVWDSIHPS